jgi:hypothetical protein
VNRLEAIAATLGVSRLEARRIIAARIREAVTDTERPRTTTSWGDAAILEALRRFVAVTGRLPRKTDFDPRGTPALPSRKTIGRKFGTVAEALDRAGLIEIDRVEIESETPEILTLF